MPPPTAVRSFSKINLGLRIGPPRADGFHDLTTLFQTVALHDVVTVHAEPSSATEILLDSNDPRLPRDMRNTAVRMIAAALTAMNLTARVDIHLQKNLPPQGGMGAGSANAAAALLGLERQIAGWSGTVPDALSGPVRLRLAEIVGSDVPLFLIGGTVYAHNRGELVVPYPDLPSAPCVVVLPGVGSSTPAAFRAWDERMASVGAEAAQARLDELSRTYASALMPSRQAGNLAQELHAQDPHGQDPHGQDPHGQDSLAANPHAQDSLAANPFATLSRNGISNDFEEVVFLQHPFLRALKHALLGPGTGPSGGTAASAEQADGSATAAMLSGSGSSLFGLYRSVADAEAARRRVLALRGEPGGGLRALLTHTVTRQEYWGTMFSA